MGVGITAIGTATGSKCLDNIAQGIQFGREEAFIREKIGFLTLCRIDKEQTSLSLAVEAFRNLQEKCSITPQEIDCYVVVTQNPTGSGLPHMSARLHHQLKLGRGVAAFDISLGCSGYVYALHVVSAFMQTTGLRRGIICTVDPYSTILDSQDAVTSLLFGDAATCTLLTNTPRYSLKKGVFSTDGTQHSALIKADDQLFMDGRKIFNFSLTAVPQQIQECLTLNSLRFNDVDSFIFHQASRFIVESLGKKLGISQEKIPFCLSDVGNCVSSTIPFVLSRRWEEKAQTTLLAGFGVGLSWASTIIQRVG